MNDQIFDDIATNYDDVLNQGLAASGETREYFARKRLLELRRLLEKFRIPTPRSILDYGCGIGGAFESLKEIFPDATLAGTDISFASLQMARKKYGGLGALFLTPEEIGDQRFDLIFCNGVFHHIKPLDRLPVLEFIRDHLAPEGLFGFFENNPWNPGTMHIMRKCAFDKDAMVISPNKAVRLLESQGFQWIVLHTLFYFPRSLAFLRPLENFLGRFPLGAQYLVLCRASP